MNTAILDQITSAIDKVLKAHPAAPSKGGRRTTQVMTPTALVAYVLDQIQGAVKEPEDKSMQRLKALRALVEKAKTAFADDSEVEFDVYPFDTTANLYLTSQDISPLEVAGSGGAGSFAENPEDLHKQLAALGKQIEALKDSSTTPAAGEPAAAPQQRSAKASDDLWPSDMNTLEKRTRAKKREDLSWGRDPDLGGE
jgi:hypothetical protein